MKRDQYEVLREVYEVTEYRNGCIFKTKYIEDRWVSDSEPPPQGYLYVVKSDPDVPSIRRVK